MIGSPDRLIVLELNELCPALLDRLMAAGDLPNFGRLHTRAEVFVTTTADPSLEPWVQWVSYHTGLPQAVHGVNELDEGHRISAPQIWDRTAAAGLDTLVFGAMNAGPAREERLSVVPDPWSRHVPCSDPEFAVFHRFIAHKVAEHANPDARSGLSELAAFVRFTVSHGLSLRTVSRGMAQVLREKARRSDRRWHRATILDLLAWDVFRDTWKRRQPDVAFFFANSVAFYQHRYWRHMAPEQYTVKPSAADMRAYGDAIATGYRALDALVGEAMEMAGPTGAVVLVTALSQQANLKYEDIGGKFVHRPRDFAKLLAWLGAPAGGTVEPVMTHEAWASYDTVAQADAFVAALNAVTAEGQPVFGSRRDGSRVMFWCDFIRPTARDLTMSRADGTQADFGSFFAPVGYVNASKHHPEGAFWIMAPNRPHRVEPQRIPLEDATRRTLDLMGLQSSDRAVA
jgi:hypothetical protein